MRSERKASGFTVVEGIVVVMLVGLVIAFAAPIISHSMREHRLSSAVREITDLLQKAKTQAMAENQTASLVVDTAERRVGLVVYDAAGTAVRTDYVPLPEGISFERPAGAGAPMPGAPVASAVSFPRKGSSSTVFQQDFNSRGFPVVTTSGDINALYLTNGDTFRAITMTSVGGIRAWWWEDGAWITSQGR